MTEKYIEAVARSLGGVAPGAAPSDVQIVAAKEFVVTLIARGFAVIPKGDADQLARTRRKTGGTHPTAPGQWRVSSQDGWVGLWACPGDDGNGRPGMFCPAEAREIAMALIVMAEQEERRR